MATSNPMLPLCSAYCFAKKYTMTDTEQTNRLGVNLTEGHALAAGLIFREQAVSDFGIDAQFELKDEAAATGRLIAVQIKAGASQFINSTETGFWYYISAKHKKLWLEHSLPVLIVLCDLDSNTCYYEVVTNETCQSTGNGWKILVPKGKVLGVSSLPDLVAIASPIAAASDFSICSEKDMSYAGAKRISLDIMAHTVGKSLNRPLLGAIVRKALRIGQKSQYSRDEIAAKALAGRTADVVWGFVYLREVDRASASWVCRFVWIKNNRTEDFRSLAIEGEKDGSGLVIDWNGNKELPKFLDERRATKAKYLENVDQLLTLLPAIKTELAKFFLLVEQSEEDLKLKAMAAAFEDFWDGRFAAPLECQRLNQAIQELLATVGNIGLIYGERLSRREIQTKSLLNGYQEELVRLNGDILFLRGEVR